jgi:hypothetical protein
VRADTALRVTFLFEWMEESPDVLKSVAIISRRVEIAIGLLARTSQLREI